MPALDLESALTQLRELLLADDLVRAVASGRRHGQPPPDPERAELRPVDLKGGRHLQVSSRSGPAVRAENHYAGEASGAAVEALLALPFGNWHVETAAEVLQLRVTKRGAAQVHRAPRAAPGTVGGATVGAGGATTSHGSAAPSASSAGAGDHRAGRARGGGHLHDRAKERLLLPDDPLFAVLGADADKRRQVDAFLRQLAPVAPAVADRGDPLRAVDLGCGNAYLTFAAHRWLAGRPGGARTVGVELRPDLVARSAERAGRAGLDGLTFTAGSIEAADPTSELGGSPDVVLALHACDTATDDALARAVRWEAPVVLAAPCCHHDVQRQLGSGTSGAPAPYGLLVRHAILRERFADVLTDALRAALLRLVGYRVDVVEFVDSAHTPRNALVRAVRTGAPPTAEQVADYRGLTAAWGVQPALADRLAPELAGVLSG